MNASQQIHKLTDFRDMPPAMTLANLADDSYCFVPNVARVAPEAVRKAAITEQTRQNLERNRAAMLARHEEWLKVIIPMLAQGKSLEKMAEALGRSKNAVFNCIKFHGLRKAK